RMNSAGTGALGEFEDQITAQIGFGRGSGSEAISLIGFENVGCGAVGIGIDGDGREAQLTAGAEDAQGDFATIGDENFTKHLKQGTGYGVQGTGKMLERRVKGLRRRRHRLDGPMPPESSADRTDAEFVLKRFRMGQR